MKLLPVCTVKQVQSILRQARTFLRSKDAERFLITQRQLYPHKYPAPELAPLKLKKLSVYLKEVAEKGKANVSIEAVAPSTSQDSASQAKKPRFDLDFGEND